MPDADVQFRRSRACHFEGSGRVHEYSETGNHVVHSPSLHHSGDRISLLLYLVFCKIHPLALHKPGLDMGPAISPAISKSSTERKREERYLTSGGFPAPRTIFSIIIARTFSLFSPIPIAMYSNRGGCPMYDA